MPKREYEVDDVRTNIALEWTALTGALEWVRYKARVPRNTGGVYADIRRGFPRGDNAVDYPL